ncbi:glycosyltransferase [Chryseobacterium salipaludis]|uniref:glycosyltransferase family 2 protein n=1 Tax=Chryseobacterium TaxID=59732 RepID=UPI001FF4A0A0|nr:MULTISPECIES: glycosyltransferase family 2 protein [Chryseobacterium]MCJ8497154.1 glycosyltransferase [Chryseobacterium salipaludis]MCX3296636.1 glycosyltransferase family 2 protein [Planobacterium sp. JC490]
MDISIVVPFYNVEEYFKTFLESLLPLDDNIEVILVDDGSVDNSTAIAEEYVAVYPNVRLLRKPNGGLSSARNHGAKHAIGTHIIFFDSDDYIENKDVIREMYNIAITNDSDIVVAPYYEFEIIEKKKLRNDRHAFPSQMVKLEEKMNSIFANTASLAVWNKMYKISFLERYQITFLEGKWFEDLDYIFKCFYFASKINKTENVLLGYRQRANSIMQTISFKILDKLDILDNLFQFLKSQNALDKFYDRFKVLYIRMVFSIIYSAITKTRDKPLSEQVVEYTFNHHFFKEAFSSKIKSRQMMTFSEKSLFFLIKNNIVNKRNISYLRYFSFLRK